MSGHGWGAGFYVMADHGEGDYRSIEWLHEEPSAKYLVDVAADVGCRVIVIDGRVIAEASPNQLPLSGNHCREMPALNLSTMNILGDK